MSWNTLWVHFVHLHVWNTIVVLEEGNSPLPRFPHCEMFVPWEAFNRSHLATSMCAKGAERKFRWRVDYESHTSMAEAFQAYGLPLGAVISFKYIVRVLTAFNYDYPVLVNNMRKLWRKWVKFYRVWGQGGGRHPVLRHILQVSCPCDPIFWIRYLGDNPQYQAYPQRVPSQGGPLSSGNESVAQNNEMVVLFAF